VQDAISDYSVRFDVAYPEGENRWMLLVRWLLVIPHMLVLGALQWIANVLLTVMLFVLLFTARFPESIFGFMSGVARWQYNATAYLMFHNRYPPFSLDADEYPPVTFEVDRQETYSRWLPFVKWLLVFPHLVILVGAGSRGLLRLPLRVLRGAGDRSLPSRRLRLPRWYRALGGTSERVRGAVHRQVPAVLAALRLRLRPLRPFWSSGFAPRFTDCRRFAPEQAPRASPLTASADTLRPSPLRILRTGSG
jgi:hypothetical protein